MTIDKTRGLIVVYGSYGYTGKLIVDECKKQNLSIILAGRDEIKLREQHTQTGYPFEVVDINDATRLKALLLSAELVIHCAGPFQYTAKAMAFACLETQTHYTDITGEYNVFDSLSQLDSNAKKAGIQILPGTGFDVVPSDCLALHLKQRLPQATHLQLAFSTGKGGGLSRGTARTSIEGLGDGSTVRENGKLVTIPYGIRNLEVDFGAFNGQATCIPWGDVVTAFVSTGIPNIEVYMGMPRKVIKKLRWVRYIGALLRARWVKNLLRRQIDKRPSGPAPERRVMSQTYLWGKVKDEKGNVAVTRLETMNGYSLTAAASVLIAEKILNGEFTPGYQTPATAYGADLIMALPSSVRTDL